MIKLLFKIWNDCFTEHDAREETRRKRNAELDAAYVEKKKKRSLERYHQYQAAVEKGFNGGSQWTSWIYPNYKKLEKWEEEQRRIQKSKEEQERWSEIKMLLRAEPPCLKS